MDYLDLENWPSTLLGARSLVDTGCPKVRNPGFHLGSECRGDQSNKEVHICWHSSDTQEKSLFHSTAPPEICSEKPVTRPSGMCFCHSSFSAKIGSQRLMRPHSPGAFAITEYRKPEGGKKPKRLAAKVPSWRDWGNLENINWSCHLAFGGWVAILSLHPRVSLTSLI